MTNLVAW